jgi:hypothetical protein
MRAILLLIPLLAGCAHPRSAQVNHASFHSPGIERALQYWTANYSGHPANHFFVYATEVDEGELVRALVYWREGGRILDYSEEPKGAEPNSWRLRPKVDRNALYSDEKVSGSNDVVPHQVWMRWMRECIDEGKEYVISLKDAKAAFPESK